MRKLFTLFVLLMTAGLYVQAQQFRTVERPDFNFEFDENARVAAHDASRTVLCGQDTNDYTFLKATSNSFIVTATDGQNLAGLGQYYPASATSPVTVTGFFFFGVVSDDNAVTTTIDCRAYNAGPDSLATGAPLTSVSVAVDTTFQGTFASIQYVANFPAPVTFTQPFVLSMENNTMVEFLMTTSNLDSADGNGEFLCAGLFNGNWLNGSTIGFGGGRVLDVDILMEPFTSFDLTSGLEVQGGVDCVSPNEVVTFEEAIVTEIAFNPIYNRLANPNSAAFDTTAIVAWDLDDGSGVSGGNTASTSYPVTGSYNVLAGVNVLGYFIACSDADSITFEVADPPVAGFDATTIDSTNKAITVTSTSLNADNVTFFLGTDSVSGSPATFVPGMPGSYDITIVAEGCNQKDTFTDTVIIPELASINGELANAVNVFPNPTSGELNVELVNIAGQVNVTLRNIVGQEVLRTNGFNRVTLDLIGLESGIYLLEGEVEGQRFVSKIQLD
ncbi:MAG: T9SS type A sorting domain-containing protein [Bacteroidota bacterium]